MDERERIRENARRLIRLADSRLGESGRKTPAAFPLPKRAKRDHDDVELLRALGEVEKDAQAKAERARADFNHAAKATLHDKMNQRVGKLYPRSSPRLIKAEAAAAYEAAEAAAALGENPYHKRNDDWSWPVWDDPAGGRREETWEFSSSPHPPPAAAAAAKNQQIAVRSLPEPVRSKLLVEDPTTIVAGAVATAAAAAAAVGGRRLIRSWTGKKKRKRKK